ncbi:hypothetical protein P692DRAFT_201864061 [Suillus brevipes Sb2]|nr:hypothetical protein P692DRAFT_201864061 [Suillus brevipes Sb2]
MPEPSTTTNIAPPPHPVVPVQSSDSITLIPATPGQIKRYDRIDFQGDYAVYEVPKGPLDCSEELQALASGLEPLTNPEGALFFYHSHKRVFTDADIRTSGMVANIGKAVEKAYQEVGNAGKQKAARGKHDMKRLLNSEIPGQRRNKQLDYQRTTYSPSQLAYAGSPSSSRSLDLRTFFDGIRPSSDKKGKHEELTYGDAVGVDDGVRPYVLFFCLSWFQKKKKLDPPRPVYDDELDDDESEHAVAGVSVPTIRKQLDTHKEMKLTPKTFFQSQPEAGPSHPIPPVDDGQVVVNVSIPPARY